MRKARIYYARVDEFWTKEQKLQYIDQLQSAVNIEWQEINPDEKHTWLTTGLESELSSFLLLGDRQAKVSVLPDLKVIFKNYGRGVSTCRDAWTFNFNSQMLAKNVQKTVSFYNEQVYKWQHYENQRVGLSSFLNYDDSQISWSEGLKNCVNRGIKIEFNKNCYDDRCIDHLVSLSSTSILI